LFRFCTQKVFSSLDKLKVEPCCSHLDYFNNVLTFMDRLIEIA